MGGKNSLRYASAAEMPAGMRAAYERQAQPRQVLPERDVVPPKKRSKYGAKKVEVDGIKFDSAKEARRYQQLLLEMRAGTVRWFTMQVPFWLEGGVKFVIDFQIQYADGRLVFEDTKSEATMLQAYRNKKKQFKARYGLDVVES